MQAGCRDHVSRKPRAQGEPTIGNTLDEFGFPWLALDPDRLPIDQFFHEPAPLAPVATDVHDDTRMPRGAVHHRLEGICARCAGATLPADLLLGIHRVVEALGERSEPPCIEEARVQRESALPLTPSERDAAKVETNRADPLTGHRPLDSATGDPAQAEPVILKVQHHRRARLVPTPPYGIREVASGGDADERLVRVTPHQFERRLERQRVAERIDVRDEPDVAPLTEHTTREGLKRQLKEFRTPKGGHADIKAVRGRDRTGRRFTEMMDHWRGSTVRGSATRRRINTVAGIVTPDQSAVPDTAARKTASIRSSIDLRVKLCRQ